MKTMPVGKLLFSMGMPLVTSMVVQALYNVVDSIYVSQVSESAVTALGLAFAIQNLQIGAATGIAVGVNSLLSKSLGENNRQRASLAAGNGILLTLIGTAVFVLFGVFLARPYFEMQSDVAQTVEGGAAYLSICCIWSLGSFVSILMERLLQATGRTMYTMYTQATGAILNILLDPVFIFGFGPIPAMGVAGAAVATVIGQWAAAILGIFFNLKFNHDITLSLKAMKPKGEAIGPILTVGVPSMVMMGIGSVMNFGMNQILLGFEGIGETAAGVFSIYFKLQSFFFMPIIGINNAVISIVAFNYGARQPKRITSTLKLTVLTDMCITLLGCAVFQLAPELLLNIFNPSDSFLHMGAAALGIISLHFPMAAIGIPLGASFQGLGNGIYSTITSLCRQLIVLLPAAWLLSLSGDVNMVWWAFPIAEVVSAAVSLFLFARIYRKKLKPLYQD